MAETVHENESNNLLTNDKMVLIDVSEPDAVTVTGQVPGAIHLPLTTFDIENKDLKDHKDDTVYVMCRSGKRSERVQHMLIDEGYDAVNVEGGILEYEGDREEL